MENLTINEKGELFLGAEPLGFNEKYAGYYPGVFFACTCMTDAGYAAAGNDENGNPVLFRSVLGHEWTQTPLISRPEDGYIPAEGKVLSMRYDNALNRIYIDCDNGTTVMIPDCRKCIRILPTESSDLDQ